MFLPTVYHSQTQSRRAGRAGAGGDDGGDYWEDYGLQETNMSNLFFRNLSSLSYCSLLRTAWINAQGSGERQLLAPLDVCIGTKQGDVKGKSPGEI